ncbi:hypothetical protein VTN77DRAFT_6054 [Rasamsonia byssochlamydoides]|uniref:uncharacterized protein n=1 Tax=Rasamsonia byssochlamydoides TaxID=89139 RepID=UPI003742F9BF
MFVIVRGTQTLSKLSCQDICQSNCLLLGRLAFYNPSRPLLFPAYRADNVEFIFQQLFTILEFLSMMHDWVMSFLAIKCGAAFIFVFPRGFYPMYFFPLRGLYCTMLPTLSWHTRLALLLPIVRFSPLFF